MAPKHAVILLAFANLACVLGLTIKAKEPESQLATDEHIFTGVANSLSGPVEVQMTGNVGKSWWGTEHMPPVAHAANYAKGKDEPCVVVEVGAHEGSVALMAAKLGCEVYAYEMQELHVKAFKENLVRNNIPSDKVHVFNLAVGSEPGSRIDETFPNGKHVTLLKMDIDGPDPNAMRGAEGLFKGGVDFINLEFNPHKQGQDKNYLSDLHTRGYDIFLLDCYSMVRDERPDHPKRHNHKVVDYEPLRQQMGASCLRDNGPSELSLEKAKAGMDPPEEETNLLACVMGGECTKPDLMLSQQIPGDKTEEFAALLVDKTNGYGGEVDMILRSRDL